MGYDFSRFRSTSFEQFVQTLALHVFGPGLQVYGAGPDGARDASFSGRPNYPSRTSPWNGYTVIQAKFKEHPLNDYRDADWLVKRIEEEAEEFLSTERDLKKPDFYLIVSNVKLSPLEGTRGRKRTGGLAKVQEALEAFKSSVGCKECDVWHRDKLERLIETAPDTLKRSYAAWLTPSDLIWDVLNRTDHPDFSNIIARAMAQDLRENRSTRLQEAGHSDAEGTLLTQVFVDLPFQTEFDDDLGLLWQRIDPAAPDQGNLLALTDDEDEAEEDDETIVRSFVELSSQRMNTPPEIIPSNDEGTSDPLGRVVVLGGPGQGKSTVGQFLVQLFAAQYLSIPKAPNVAPETKSYAAAIKKATLREGITQPAPFRIPIRIVLPTYADNVAAVRAKSRGRFSLLDYAAEHISRQANSEISTEILRKWIKAHPWLIVLDGLDEVPASGERKTVLNEIEALFDEISAADSDTLVVVTTRQQGYNRDLSPKLWRHWTLTPLSPKHALRYAERLAEVRLNALERRSRVLKRLSAASQSSSTAQLMVSPLQVAILFTLVDLKGDVPTDRWSLFDRYFSVLRDREEGKGGAFSETLRRHRTSIELIHQHAGFALQLAAEQSGRADSYLTKKQFEHLVRQYLEQEEHPEEDLAQLTTSLATLATQRLVLLASKVEDRIAFDVRSLQEFMAAAMITASKDTLVEDRLRSIAGRVHWRHVVQIAASRCYADTGKRHLADFIITLCTELDAGHLEDADRANHSGARLAIDLLADGLANESPKHRRLLFDRGLSSLDLGPNLFDRRLAGVVDKTLVAFATAAIRERVVRGSLPSLAAWKLLSDLVKSQPRLFTQLALELWPEEPSEAAQVIEFLDREVLEKPEFRSRALDSMRRLGAEGVVRNRGAWYQLANLVPNTFLSPRPPLYRSHGTVRVRIDKIILPRVMRLISLAEGDLYSGFPPGFLDSPDWRPIRAVAEFVTSPSKSSLADTLHVLAEVKDFAILRSMSRNFPWVLSTLISNASGSESLQETEMDVRKGEFGDFEDWVAAEARWLNDGISEADLEYARTQGRHFGSDVSQVGMPSIINAGSTSLQLRPPRANARRRAMELDTVTTLKDMVAETSSPTIRQELLYLLSSALLAFLPPYSEYRDQIEELAASDEYMFVPQLIRNALVRHQPKSLADFEVMASVGKRLTPSDIDFSSQFVHSNRIRTKEGDENVFARTLSAHHEMRGLLPFALMERCLDGRKAKIKKLDSKILAPQLEDGPGLRFALSTLRLLGGLGTLTERAEAIRSIALANEDQSTFRRPGSIARLVLARVLKDVDGRNAAARAISELAADVRLSVIISELRIALDARYSDFADRTSWEKYGLPPFLYETVKDAIQAHA